MFGSGVVSPSSLEPYSEECKDLSVGSSATGLEPEAGFEPGVGAEPGICVGSDVEGTGSVLVTLVDGGTCGRAACSGGITIGATVTGVGGAVTGGCAGVAAEDRVSCSLWLFRLRCREAERPIVVGSEGNVFPTFGSE